MRSSGRERPGALVSAGLFVAGLLISGCGDGEGSILQPSGPDLEFLFIRNGGVYLSSGNQTIPLASGTQAAWSPDGTLIAFINSENVYLMTAVGSNIRPLTSKLPDGSGYRALAWSPDGGTLAINTGSVYQGDVFLLAIENPTAPPVRIATMAADPAWSPDGQKIAFVSLSGDDGNHALHLMNADGSGISELTLRDGGDIYRPAWSPDGERIAFSKCLRGCDIHVMLANGSAATQVTNLGNAGTPAWTSGGQLAFTRWAWGDPAGHSIMLSVDGTAEPVLLVTNAALPAFRP